jgi:uncharacterized protein YkwD
VHTLIALRRGAMLVTVALGCLLPASAARAAAVSLPSATPGPFATATVIESSNTTGGDATVDRQRDRVLQWTNAKRAAINLPPVGTNAKLDTAAQTYADHLAADGAFGHTDGSTLDQRIDATGYGYQWVGENLGMGQTSPWGVVHDWMHSADHRGNLLDGRFTEAGVGIARRADGQLVWCLDLGQPQ